MTNQVMELFKLAVYTHLYQTKPGHLISYGELAKLAGQPNYSRMVGRILKELPRDTELPWFRVVRSNREIAFPEGSSPYERQKEQLEQEGWIIKGRKIYSIQKS
ncbi:cysteine methyltransferase [Marinomonas agarivorans]|nr:cysteine methyltransferase [Marinomonas agarivorans]